MKVEVMQHPALVIYAHSSILELDSLCFCDPLCHNDQLMPHINFHVAYIEILANFIAFPFKPFGKIFMTFGRIPQ
jgi:hypothetical protein